MKLRVATRKSALALAQTTMAADAIVAANSAQNAELSYELVSMTTEGDRRLDKSLASFGGKGVFIKELEIALLENRADIAVHSLKDMPAEVLPDFKLAAVLKREDPRDAFLSRGGAAGVRFMDLPAGSRVGTGSIRRIVQLKALRPDLEYVPIRGNIQTRIGKLADLDGVVLAAAGLKRMGLADKVTEYFSTEQVLPASGQGILAIETLSDNGARHSEQREDNSEGECCKNEKVHFYNRAEELGLRAAPSSEVSESLSQMLARVNDVESFCVASAEMAYLKALNAGCQFPVASFAEFFGDDGSESGKCESVAHEKCANRITKSLKIRGIYWDEKSNRLLRAECLGSIDLSSADCVQHAKNLGVALASEIKKQL